MRQPFLRGGLLGLVGWVGVACGGDDSSAPNSVGADGGIADGGVLGADAAHILPAPEQPFVVDHVADVPCVDRGGSLALVYPATKLGLEALGKIGTRRVATTLRQGGFVMMDADGANASAPIGIGDLNRDVNRAVGAPASVGLATLGDRAIRFTRYDVSAKSISPTVTISADPAYDVFLGRSGERSLVVWWETAYTRAVVMNEEGAVAGAPFDLETDDKTLTGASIASGIGAGFLVAWSKKRATDQQHRLLTVRCDSGGPVGLAHKLLGQAASIRVRQLVRLAAGHALLLDLDGAPAVVPLDGYGRLAGHAQLFDGVDQGLGLAAHVDGLGLVAWRKDQRPAFRPLNATGVPTGPWVCLDGPAPLVEPSVTIDDEPNGFAVLFHAADGSLKLARFDRMGTGSP